MKINVQKRNGSIVDYDERKIVTAINKAMTNGSGIYKPDISFRIAKEITSVAEVVGSLSIKQIEDMVYSKLIEYGEPETAKAYEGYRAVQEYKRQKNTTDDSIMSLVNQTNVDVMGENSNKDAKLNSTQRDLIAGEVSRDMVQRKLFPSHLVQAHKEGKIYIHDTDYLLQPMTNCCIIDLESMLRDGTVINKKQITSPKSFQVASTVTTQIILQVTNGQFGGASINGIDRILAPYARKSYNKYFEKHLSRLNQLVKPYSSENITIAEKYAEEDLKKEIRDGIQTMQYQINTFSGSNGRV